MLVHDLLLQSAGRTPDKAALLFGSDRYTYEEFLQPVEALARFLVRNGLERGDRVIINLGNQPETAVCVFAVLMAGGCFSVVNPGVKEGKLSRIIRNAEPRFIVAPHSLDCSILPASREMTPVPTIIYFDRSEPGFGLPAGAGGGEEKYPRIIDEDLAAIIYTSGSTGDPKGVTMSHRNVVAASTSITTYLDMREDDVVLNALPFSFDYGLYQLIMSMQVGATLVVEPTFAYPYQLLELIRRHQVTGLPLVPTIMALLLQLKVTEEETFPSIRYITNTAAAMPVSYPGRLQRAFPNARIYSMYGLTECKRVSYLPPELLQVKPGSVGVPMPNLEVSIVNESGQEVPRGETGELIVRGATVMRGYWRDPEGTAARLVPGKYPWERVLRTGDLFRMDEDGCLYFVARNDDIIKCRGERVHPKEIEDVLYQLEGVLHARVVGVPDEILGMAIRAEVVPVEGSALDDKAIMAHCRRHLEPLLVPQFIWIVPSLALTDSGKIRRTVEEAVQAKEAKAKRSAPRSKRPATGLKMSRGLKREAEPEK